MTYYVYQLIDPKNNKPFYIGKGTKRRAYQHATLRDGNNNPHKNRVIQKIIESGYQPIIEFLHQDILDAQEAYLLEEQEISRIGLTNLTNLTPSARPPSKQGWKPSEETLTKRRQNLKGIPRTKQWCENLSLSKQGIKNPRFGKKEPCSNERRMSVIKGKNLPRYNVYKTALEMLSHGMPADKVAKELSIGRGICFRLKNGTHGIFTAFPELKKIKTC